AWIGHDFPESMPLPRELAIVRMTVEESVLYPLGVAGDQAWRSLLTTSGGYCRLGPQNRLFAVTMFHELHCLGIFNAGFGAGTELAHVLHCLSYLRHGVLCSADLTLEAGDFMSHNFTRDRVGATHQCRDWSQLYETFDSNWATWKATSERLFAVSHH
ncbi:hypothetical protein AURDEDRAFT_63137, partial [Auricularia subglabra TFB-10046 SS5]